MNKDQLAQVTIETDRNPTTPGSVCVFLRHLIDDKDTEYA